MNFDDIRTTILPQFFPADWLNEIHEIVYSDFPSRIRIGYVRREQGAYSYLLQDELADFHLELGELNSLALTNLRELPSARITIAHLAGGAEGYISADDNFAAVRLLVPEVRTQFASELGGEFFSVLPHRDECFCWSREQANDRQTRHAAEALEDFYQDDYRLTPDIFLVSEKGFQVHKLQ